MSVFDRILKEVPEGLVLYTPVKRKRFVVKSIESKRERMVFLAGTTPIEVSKKCWNGVPDFLRGKGWVEIRPEHVVLDKLREGSFEKYLRENSLDDTTRESQGSYAVPLLKYLDIVEVNPSPPSRIRLKQSSTEK